MSPKDKGLTREDIEALPLGSRIEDKDEDQYVKMLDDSGNVTWVDPESGESTDTVVYYGGLRLLFKPDVTPPPATNERLVEVAQRVANIYFLGGGSESSGRDLHDAMVTLNIELSTLKETP